MRYVILILFFFYFKSYCQTDTLNEYKRAVSLSVTVDIFTFYSVSFRQNIIKNNHKYFFEFGTGLYIYDPISEYITYTNTRFTFRLSKKFQEVFTNKKENIALKPEISMLYLTELFKTEHLFDFHKMIIPTVPKALSSDNYLFACIDLNYELYNRVALSPGLQLHLLEINFRNINGVKKLNRGINGVYLIGSFSISYLF